MSGPSTHELKKVSRLPIPIYGSESFVTADGEITGLRVGLNGTSFNLERIDVDAKESPTGWNSIFYLDISRRKDNMEIFEAATEWIKEQILANDISLLVIPKSHKSTDAFQEAVDRAKKESKRDIRLIELLGGKEGEVGQEVNEALVEHYVPITTPEGKWMSMKVEDAKFLYEKAEEARQNGENLTVWIGDDVISTNETIRAMERLLERATDGNAKEKYLVIALEVLDTNLPVKYDATEKKASMVILEFVGGTSPTRKV